MLVGRDQGLGATLERCAEELGIADNILWLGERVDAQSLIAAADIGVCRLTRKAFPTA